MYRARQDWHWCRVREYGRPKWPITMLNHTDRHLWYRIMFGFLFLAPYARTTRYEEAFLPEGKKRPPSLRSLGLASLQYVPLHFSVYSRLLMKSRLGRV